MGIKVPGPESVNVTQDRLSAGQVSTSVNAQTLVGPTLRRLEAMGRTQEEITGILETKKATEDLTAVTAMQAGWRDVRRIEKLRLTSKKNVDAKNVLSEAEAFYDGNARSRFSDPDGAIEGPSDPKQFQNESPELLVYEKMYKGATTDQKMAWDAIRAKGRDDFLNSMMEHQDTQLNAAATMAHKVGLQSALADAQELTSSTTVDSKTFKDGMSAVKTSVVALMDAEATRLGIARNIAAEYKKIAISSMHESVVNGFLATGKNNADADEYLRSHKPELVGDAASELIGKVDSNMLLSRAMTEADRIVTLPRGDRLEAIRKLNDDKLEAKVISQLRMMDSQINAADLKKNREANKSMHNYVRSKENAPRTEGDLKAHTVDGVNLWDELLPSQREGYLSIVEDIGKGERTVNEKTHLENYAAVYEKLAKAQNDEKTRTEFMAIDFESTYYGKMNKSAIEFFTAKKAALLSGDNSVITEASQMSQNAIRLFPGSNQGGQRATFISDMQNEIITFREKHSNRNPTARELRNIIEDGTKYGSVSYRDKLNRQFPSSDNLTDVESISRIHSARVKRMGLDKTKAPQSKFMGQAEIGVQRRIAIHKRTFRRNPDEVELGIMADMEYGAMGTVINTFSNDTYKSAYELTDEQLLNFGLTLDNDKTMPMKSVIEFQRSKPKVYNALIGQLKMNGITPSFKNIGEQLLVMGVK